MTERACKIIGVQLY